MAIPKELEPLMEGFTADEKSLFDNLMTKQYTAAKAKDPNGATLQEGWLRQQEFDKRSNQWKGDLDKAKAAEQQMRTWWNDNKPIHDAALEHNRELEAKLQEESQQREELQRKLSEAETRRAAEGGEQVDPAEVRRQVAEEAKALGWLSKSEMDSLIAAKYAQLESDTKSAIEGARKELWEQSFPQIANHAADISEIAYDHKSEFSEPFDRLKFTEFLSENKISDFKKGYEQFVKPRRDDRDFKKRVDAEVEQRMSGLNVTGGLPVPGGPQQKGALQMRIEKDNATPTSSTAAAIAAAAELRSEGHF